MAKTIVNQGPSGGFSGTPFDDGEYVGSPTAGLAVRYAKAIDNLGIVYGGTTVRHGGDGGELEEVKFATGEYIVAVGGTFDTFVRSLVIETNVRRLTYGTPVASTFSYEAPDGYRIVGFLGHSGTLLDAVGVIIGK